MGKLPDGPFEAKLAATLFLLLLGLANIFGAWQVKNFAAFTPGKVAEQLRPAESMENMDHGNGKPMQMETPVTIDNMNAPSHHVDRELLVQDTHVHIPVYALCSAALSLVVLGLRFSSRARSILILALFAAPVADFAGLWGAHLYPASGVAFGTIAIAGGFGMGIAYLIVLFVSQFQFWFSRKETHHA